MFLVDTNVLSEARRRTPQAVRWLQSVPSHSLHVSVISIGEIMRGLSAKRTKDPQTADRLLEWLMVLRHDFSDRIEIIDEDIALEWGRLSVLRSRCVADGLLAATAIVRRLTLVTRNVVDFADLPLVVINPWDQPRDDRPFRR